MSRILLTGATGFIGCHLAHRLLRGGHSLVLLARARGGLGAPQRVRALFAHLDRFDRNALPYRGSYAVITGDVREPLMGAERSRLDRALSDVTEIWHCAVLSTFDERNARQIDAVNIDGTGNVLDLAGEYDIERFHCVSTAYVAGDQRQGTVYEAPCVEQSFRNSYERSKCRMEAEVLRRMESAGLDPTIYRIGIVVGDSRTGESTHFDGAYRFARVIHMIRSRLAESDNRGSVVSLPLRIPCASGATLNLVTIDFVTRVLEEIRGNRASSGKIVHITNPKPVICRDLWKMCLDHMHISDFTFVESPQDMDVSAARETSDVERQILYLMLFYQPYLQGEPVFDTTNARSLSRDFSHPTFTRGLVGRLLDFATAANWQSL